jgi:hypothetical protein
LNEFASGRGRGGQGAIEVVGDRQHVVDHVRGGPIDHLLAIAIDALAEVVELGGLAEQAIEQLVAFLLQFSAGDVSFADARRARVLRIDVVRSVLYSTGAAQSRVE